MATYAITKGDPVEVISGKDRGKRASARGPPPRLRVIVENINLVKEHRDRDR